MSLQDYCDPLSNTCQERLQMGDDCVASSEALADLRRSPCPLSGQCGFSVCVPLPAEEGDCGSNGRHCLTGYYCGGSMCIKEENSDFVPCGSTD